MGAATTGCSGCTCNCGKQQEDEILNTDDKKGNKDNEENKDDNNENTIQRITANNQLMKRDEDCLQIINEKEIIKNSYLDQGIQKENISMLKDTSKSNLFNKNDIDSVNNKSKSTNQISSLLQPGNLLEEQSASNKFDFGVSHNNLTFDQQKLLSETQKNLNQFFQPQPAELKVIQSKLAKIPLTSIVSEYKLLSQLSENEVIFNGELRKLINYEVKSHKPQMYSSRFCTLSKTVFSYYKSTETYLTMNKPLCQVPLNQMTKLLFIKIKQSSKKIDHILICNKLGIIKDKKDISKSKQFEQYEQNAIENNESLLIFTSEIEEGLYKWYLILNFLLNNSQ